MIREELDANAVDTGAVGELAREIRDHAHAIRDEVGEIRKPVDVAADQVDVMVEDVHGIAQVVLVFVSTAACWAIPST